jgi:peptidoglycan pentaglycine glycine transferase (the first glycine)
MENKLLNFIQSNSPEGGFLQSVYWRKFQEAWGRKTYNISASDESGELLVYANIVTHKLPIAGKYFYVPRSLVLAQSAKLKTQNHSAKLKTFFSDLINLAKKNNIGWIRIEPADDEVLNLIRENLSDRYKIKKSSVDMQPKEILVLDITKSEEELLAGMKQKTRYNIKLAEKKGAKVYESRKERYIEEFLRLVKITSKRDKITSHPKEYYRQMFEAIPGDILKLYIAEFEGKIIAANLVLFFGRTATYMHGASDNKHRSVMAPYLLQWRQIQDAKKAGCERYDFGGVKICNTKHVTCPPAGEAGNKNSWGGITRFKQGFALNVQPIQFSGCYDIILNSFKYKLYRFLQRIKRTI